MAEIYVVRGSFVSKDQYEIEVDRLATHFHMNAHTHKGVLYIETLPGFVIDYNIKKGEAVLKSIQVHESIKESFSDTINKHLTSIISFAISLYAQFHLLKKINELPDESYPGVKELKTIIKKNGVDALAGAKVNGKGVLESLKKICTHINKNKKHYNNLNTLDIENIRSLKDADKSINDLKLAMQTASQDSTNTNTYRSR